MNERIEIKLYGYPSAVEADQPMELAEVSLLLKVGSMRRLAEFLVHCADEMDASRKPYEIDTHFHLRDFADELVGADLIVVPVRDQPSKNPEKGRTRR